MAIWRPARRRSSGVRVGSSPSPWSFPLSGLRSMPGSAGLKARDSRNPRTEVEAAETILPRAHAESLMPKILVVDDEPDLEALVVQKFRRQIREGEVSFLFAHD